MASAGVDAGSPACRGQALSTGQSAADCRGRAMLSGRRDQLSIVRWGRRLSRDTLASIGISRARVPAPSVWCEMFKALDVAALERALGQWVRGGQSAGHVALDGKRLRGSATAQAAGVHLLAAFSASLQGVIGQLAVAPEANEITAALHLLKTLPLQGATITGDAMFTQTEICRTIIDGGGATSSLSRTTNRP